MKHRKRNLITIGETADGQKVQLDVDRLIKTRVLITSSNGKREWGTVGVSENIIEASWEALVTALQLELMRLLETGSPFGQAARRSGRAPSNDGFRGRTWAILGP